MAESEVQESVEWFRKRHGWPAAPDASRIQPLTADELAQAIAATHAMVRSTGQTEAAHAMYVAHLKDLLEAQRVRAGVFG